MSNKDDIWRNILYLTFRTAIGTHSVRNSRHPKCFAVAFVLLYLITCSRQQNRFVIHFLLRWRQWCDICSSISNFDLNEVDLHTRWFPYPILFTSRYSNSMQLLSARRWFECTIIFYFNEEGTGALELFQWVLENINILFFFGTGYWIYLHGPLTRYIKLPVADAPGIQGTFSPPPT